MKTTRTIVTLRCDATDCGDGHPMFALMQDFTAYPDGQTPVPTLPEGWRERRTRIGVQHACSAGCERALIDAEADAEADRLEAGPLKPGLRYEVQAVLDSPTGMDHCRAILARDVPQRDWRVTYFDEGNVRRWTAEHVPGATFDHE